MKKTFTAILSPMDDPIWGSPKRVLVSLRNAMTQSEAFAYLMGCKPFQEKYKHYELIDLY